MNAPLDRPAYGVSPAAAVTRFFGNYAVFRGRASRSEYWWAALWMTGLFAALGAVALAVGRPPADDAPSTAGAVVGILLLVCVLAAAVPSLALSVRRLHDADLSGWFLLLGLLPGAGGIILVVLAVLPTAPAGARFDRDPRPVHRAPAA